MTADKKGSERRDKERFPTRGLRGSFVVDTEARVLDLSLEGMGVECHGPLKVGHMYTFRLASPDGELPVSGRVVWCSLVRTDRGAEDDVLPVYRAGIRFESVLGDKAQDLRRFIKRNAVISVEKRLFGRFSLSRDRSASVTHRPDFEVLSLTGDTLSVETDFVPATDVDHEIELRSEGGGFSTRARVTSAELLEGAEEAKPRYGIKLALPDLDENGRRILEEEIDKELS